MAVKNNQKNKPEKVKGEKVSAEIKAAAMSQREIIKENVKRIIKEQGKIQEDIAKLMEIKPETLSRALNGNPTLITLQQIAGALNVPVSELFEDSNSEGEIYGVIVIEGKPVKINSIKDLEKLVNLTKPKK